MEEVMNLPVLTEHSYTENGYNLHIIPSKKFKTNVLLLRFLAPLNRNSVTKRALLPFVMQKGTKYLPTEREIRTKLDYLFGAQLNIDAAKKGENHVITFYISYINDKFLPDNESIAKEVLDIVKQVLLEPNTANNSFMPDVVEREKQTLKQKIQSIKDQKMNYANTRLIDEMCKGEPYETHVHGYIEDFEKIDGRNLYEEYERMIMEDQLDIYLLGDVQVKEAKEQIFKMFTFERNQRNQPYISDYRGKMDKVKEVIEEDQIQQGKLHIGFRTNTTFKDEDYSVLQVFNGLFGGFPISKLFRNVREKHSLAYYASSRIESHKGLLLVFSGIAPENYQKAKDIILEQLDEMKKGNFTESQVEETKRLTIHQLKETLDHPVGAIELMYHQVLANIQMNPHQMFENIQKVSKEDVVRFAEKIELDTIYFLTSAGESK
jgi:predicted Zn-dependent peptidase